MIYLESKIYELVKPSTHLPSNPCSNTLTAL